MTNTPINTPIGTSSFNEEEALSRLTDMELFAKVEYHYRDYPVVMELLYRAVEMEKRLWLARVSICAGEDDYND